MPNIYNTLKGLRNQPGKLGEQFEQIANSLPVSLVSELMDKVGLELKKKTCSSFERVFLRVPILQGLVKQALKKKREPFFYPHMPRACGDNMRALLHTHPDIARKVIEYFLSIPNLDGYLINPPDDSLYGYRESLDSMAEFNNLTWGELQKELYLN